MFVLGLSAAFIGVGYYLLSRLHDQTVPFMFFSPSVGIMILYAWGYGFHASSTYNFDAGLISARAVMRWILYMTSIAFAVAGIKMLGQPWVDPVLGMVCFWVGPILIAVFALVYGLYCNFGADILDSPEARRYGTGRRAMACMTVLSVSTFLYNIGHAAISLIVNDIWISLLSFAGDFAVCFGVMYVFQRLVSAANDRGVKAS
jgi:hypothetical protein